MEISGYCSLGFRFFIDAWEGYQYGHPYYDDSRRSSTAFQYYYSGS
jgi:hypothetical protein